MPAHVIGIQRCVGDETAAAITMPVGTTSLVHFGGPAYDAAASATRPTYKMGCTLT